MARERIGIMGGTFDPVHMGHLILAEEAYEQFKLDYIMFIPSGKPPHKRNRDGRATDVQRVEMLQMAIEGNPHFTMNLLEMESDEYSYTYRTLEKLLEQNPETEYYFIMGQDSMRDFPTWKKPERIAELCNILVAIRSNEAPELFDALFEQRNEEYGNVFHKLKASNIEISSNDLRTRAQNDRSIRYFVNDKVMQYIKDKGLYKA